MMIFNLLNLFNLKLNLLNSEAAKLLNSEALNSKLLNLKLRKLKT